MFKKQNSYANVIASLALFIALGGTATAAVTLSRDSVGSPQIRQDAVRSSEIREDAVRPPEIVSGGVRSSEIRDEGIKIADVSPAAQTALRGELRVAEDDNRPLDGVPVCAGLDLSVCPNHLVLDLGAGASSGTVSQPSTPGQAITAPPSSVPGSNWLVQAKLDVRAPSNTFNVCGLVDTTLTGPKAVLDEMLIPDAVEAAALSAVVRKGAGNPTIALRCTSQPGNVVAPSFAKLTALEVGTVTGP
jgi:hypothetical protein